MAGKLYGMDKSIFEHANLQSTLREIKEEYPLGLECPREDCEYEYVLNNRSCKGSFPHCLDNYNILRYQLKEQENKK